MSGASFHNPEASVIARATDITLPSGGVRKVPCIPLPGIIIFVHGVNSMGEWFNAAEEGLCDGLNERLNRKEFGKPVDDTIEGLLHAAQYSPELTPSGYLVRTKSEDAVEGQDFVQGAEASPIIRFRWGYVANKEDLAVVGPNILLDEDNAWGGGPFANGCTALPDLWSNGTVTDLFLGLQVEYMNTETSRLIYNCPARHYGAHAAWRLAALVAQARERHQKHYGKECPVTIVCHSQGNMVGLASAFIGDKKFGGKGVADTYVLANPPYSVLPNFADNFVQYDSVNDLGRVTTLSRRKTLDAFFGIVKNRNDDLASDDCVNAWITHVKLQDNLLVPYLVRRVEAVLVAAVADRDAKLTYDTLRVYLMLYEKAQFNASDVRGWVQNDWATGGADAFGGRITVVEHLNSLLDGSRVIQSPYARNEALIRSARDFLDRNTSTERLYDRAKAAMMEEAPADFTLVRAIGPQAGTVFSRASGEPLERGIPGLFTYAGYHNLFNARLPEFVNKAQSIDAWVMGRAGSAQKKTLESSAGKLIGDDPLTLEIRRLYLAEYAQRWTEFLRDIRALTGNNLTFDLEVLRNFAAPDSPLARLGRVVVNETTLSQPADLGDKSLAGKALSALDNKADKITGFMSRTEARQERELVDNRFAALREVVTGQADVAASNAPAATSKPRLDAIAGMVNAYYTSLMVASNALETRNLPPPSEAGAQLRMEAAKLPAPLKEVLVDLVVQGTRDVNKGIGDILIGQMNAVIGESCRSAIDGKYPFTPTSNQDVDTEDFARVFASGGVLDDFFQKVLAPHVDTTISPWRYKLTAPDVPPVAGPSLVPFQRAREIREMFFRDPGAKKMAWKVDLKVVELDPEIVELTMDFDGQSQRYVHGPVIPLKVTWPGPRGGQGVEITANPRVRPETSSLIANGPWAMMRVIGKGKLDNSVSPSHFVAEYDFDGRKAKLDVNTGSQANPWTTGLLQGFQCPGRSG